MSYRLIACLLYEMSRGEASEFAPYLRTLPYPTTLYDWGPVELSELHNECDTRALAGCIC
jgi:hypothetical protein